MAERQRIPARKGAFARLKTGQHLKVINTHGTQVVDMWAVASDDPAEFMSMCHTHSYVKRLVPAVGEHFVTWRRRPILTMVEDHSPGAHDTTYPCCDEHRYRLDGVAGHHDSCGENFATALKASGIASPPYPPPQPFNLWQNCPVLPDGRIGFAPPISKPGDYMILRAAMDCIVAMSACPQDILPINGRMGTTTEAHYEIVD